ncbi:MAG: hypothetical protein MUF36_06995 [Bacteroidales bacterium]|jgi:hypothetical protein|nr:hypothetical protein [Bacteroidales bacterium]
MKSILIKISIFCILAIYGIEAIACTTFIISGKYTPDGKPVLYKNRDTDEMHNSLVYFSDGKYKYIGLVDGNEDWNNNVWGGYNETGFAIINSAAYNNNLGDTSKFHDQEGIVMKLALQTCKTLEDFENLLRNMLKPLGVDANFGVIDANGGAAFYETGNYKFVKFDANDPAVAPDGILIRTNHSTSADITKGYGFCRYYTADIALKKAVGEKNFSPQYLFDNISRNLYHSLTKTDLLTNIPEKRTEPNYKFFIDYIPRQITASAIMIVGARDEKHIGDAMMWTILGFPLTSVSVPVWISAGDKLPECVAMTDSLRAPLCEAALKFKEECFPITYDRGTNYINLSAIINKENNGYLQLLRPIENGIFEMTYRLIEGLEKGKKSVKDIQDFYKWLDQYLSTTYNEKLNYILFNN